MTPISKLPPSSEAPSAAAASSASEAPRKATDVITVPANVVDNIYITSMFAQCPKVHGWYRAVLGSPFYHGVLFICLWTISLLYHRFDQFEPVLIAVGNVTTALCLFVFLSVDFRPRILARCITPKHVYAMVLSIACSIMYDQSTHAQEDTAIIILFPFATISFCLATAMNLPLFTTLTMALPVTLLWPAALAKLYVKGVLFFPGYKDHVISWGPMQISSLAFVSSHLLVLVSVHGLMYMQLSQLRAGVPKMSPSLDVFGSRLGSYKLTFFHYEEWPIDKWLKGPVGLAVFMLNFAFAIVALVLALT